MFFLFIFILLSISFLKSPAQENYPKRRSRSLSDISKKETNSESKSPGLKITKPERSSSVDFTKDFNKNELSSPRKNESFYETTSPSESDKDQQLSRKKREAHYRKHVGTSRTDFIKNVIKRLKKAKGLADTETDYIIEYLKFRSVPHAKYLDFATFGPTNLMAEDKENLFKEDSDFLNTLHPYERTSMVGLCRDNHHNNRKIKLLGKLKDGNNILSLDQFVKRVKTYNKTFLEIKEDNKIKTTVYALDLNISESELMKNKFPEINKNIRQANPIEINHLFKTIENLAKKSLDKYDRVYNEKPLFLNWLALSLNGVSNLLEINAFDTDSFVFAILKEIKRCLLFFINSQDNPQNLYEQSILFYGFINDLIFALMAYLKPYKLKFADITQNYFNTKQYSLPDGIKISHYAASSGMDALWLGCLSVQRKKENKTPRIEMIPLARNKGGEDIYYEAFLLIKELPDQDLSSRQIFVTGMNSGYVTPINKDAQEGLSVNINSQSGSILFQELVEKIELIKNEQEFVTLIIDTTIELPKNNFINDPAKKILSNSYIQTKIKEGKLNVILFKSFQKFVALGTGKCRTGCVTLINNDSEKFLDCKDYLSKASQDNLENNDEWHFILHLLKNIPQGDEQFIKAATKNAAFVKNKIMKKILSIGYNLNINLNSIKHFKTPVEIKSFLEPFINIVQKEIQKNRSNIKISLKNSKFSDAIKDLIFFSKTNIIYPEEIITETKNGLKIFVQNALDKKNFMQAEQIKAIYKNILNKIPYMLKVATQYLFQKTVFRWEKDLIIPQKQGIFVFLEQNCFDYLLKKKIIHTGSFPWLFCAESPIFEYQRIACGLEPKYKLAKLIDKNTTKLIITPKENEKIIKRVALLLSQIGDGEKQKMKIATILKKDDKKVIAPIINAIHQHLQGQPIEQFPALRLLQIEENLLHEWIINLFSDNTKKRISEIIKLTTNEDVNFNNSNELIKYLNKFDTEKKIEIIRRIFDDLEATNLESLST